MNKKKRRPIRERPSLTEPSNYMGSSREQKASEEIIRKQPKDASLQEVTEEVDAAADVWDATEAIVTLHAGFNDVVDRDISSEKLARELKSKIQTWQARACKHRYIVYGVPKSTLSNDTVREKCKLLNDNLKRVCTELGPRVEYVSTTPALTGGPCNLLDRVSTAEEFGTRLGHRRNGPKRFWAYVSSLDRKAAAPPIRPEETHLPVTDLGMSFTEHMHKLYHLEL
ncbi:hypothetical protein HPB49_018360 [Dermacentor silvarum]|uniref:Uncharacterized protein n=1 Tax=Dermacentor silvarum TaxID=543639 RepID=A0ACB8DPY7_DERSI|nr:hypothetical protein HPB49_018360 [Dermacentor silvarum]